MAAITITEVVHPKSRQEWRNWLAAHFETAKEVWVAIPKKEKPMDYNDIIEEALCFNWIDSTLKTLDEHHTAQRMSPRKTKGNFSQLNIERIRLILDQNLVHPRYESALRAVADAPFIYPDDIMTAIKTNELAWKNFQSFSEPYKRMRISSIETAREDTILFEKRLISFIESCAQNKLVRASAGMEKYY
ncbi:YdeI family protein [Dyadobacter sp. CY312]|uniref:YdeI/OmpD-associated family protein n=1 Tax=Dyadobacter sp. CY312 TaxID=2907303 RepID=UPI001F34E121|nr:YdeI/OmpD-associated family protein [Dyadobacter sp. CY312]MCE7040298.1 YdeI/OmpD-associated family protein [Dyadobacter sp. CY312]